MFDSGDYQNSIISDAADAHPFGSFEGVGQAQSDKSNSSFNHKQADGKRDGPLNIEDLLSGSSLDALFAAP